MFRYGRTWESTLAYSGVLLAVLAPERKVLESAGFCE
jgi:hypothetical protein